MAFNVLPLRPRFPVRGGLLLALAAVVFPASLSHAGVVAGDQFIVTMTEDPTFPNPTPGAVFAATITVGAAIAGVPQGLFSDEVAPQALGNLFDVGAISVSIPASTTCTLECTITHITMPISGVGTPLVFDALNFDLHGAAIGTYIDGSNHTHDVTLDFSEPNLGFPAGQPTDWAFFDQDTVTNALVEATGT